MTPGETPGYTPYTPMPLLQQHQQQVDDEPKSPIILAQVEGQQEDAAGADTEEEKKNDARKLKATKSLEIRKQLEAKKAELLAIQKESEEILKKQQEEM